MSAPKNIQRDAIWTKPETASDLGWPLDTLVTATNAVANADPTVYTDVANAHTGANLISITASNKQTIGCYLKAPEGDNTPYRVKAFSTIYNSDKDQFRTMITIGYGPAAITGSGDTIEDIYEIPFISGIDELIMVPALSSGDTYFGRALFIGVTVAADSTITTKVASTCISVQNLAVAPPSMIYSVS